MKRVLPLPLIRMTPATEPSLKIRPVPVEPSKQVKANSLPATKRRAVSAFIGSANAGATANRPVSATAARKSISYSPLTIPTEAYCPTIVAKS